MALPEDFPRMALQTQHSPVRVWRSQSLQALPCFLALLSFVLFAHKNRARDCAESSATSMSDNFKSALLKFFILSTNIIMCLLLALPAFSHADGAFTNFEFTA
ncbi:MAG: hypothetical protein HUJ51_04130 [Eggerthellaceae bacterium]|nr:hypothetical protein [Eggerthellaceae bacterium]